MTSLVEIYRRFPNMGGRWRQLTIRADWNMSYTGREYDSRQCVNFRKCKA